MLRLGGGFVFAWALLPPIPAWAGMPSIGFSDVAALRLQAISFFLAGLVGSAVVVRWLWNALAIDFPRLPRLTFVKACGVVVVWGLLLVIVLTMISGARELMTPGAWKKQGWTYALNGSAAESSSGDGGLNAGAPRRPRPSTEVASAEHELDLENRRRQLDRLGRALWRFARVHDGRLPDATQAAEISEELWQLPTPLRDRYLYVPGLRVDDSAIVAYEPAVYPGDLFALRADGEVVQLSSAALESRVAGEEVR